MRKLSSVICVALVLALGIIVLPTFSNAAEFKYAGPPAFTVTYPDGSAKIKTDAPEQVFAMKMPDGVTIQVSVADIPEGVALKDAGEAYSKGLAESQKSEVEIISNEEIELEDGTKAYFTEMEWIHQGSTLITTFVVSVYKDGKWVYTAAHPWADMDEAIEFVKSLVMN
ncbi:MAG: hypothetical protein JRI95_14355 [Deltaproteobacteria bacterium]|nr:hypothetical protein [Deltaproteobacteria bacterium]